MHIALTYDLRADYLRQGYTEEQTAEFDQASTIDALEGALTALGHRTTRIGNVRALTGALAAGRRWDLVFNIAEGLEGFGREAQVPALLEAHGIPCTFSDSLVMSLCLHKGFTKHVLRGHGIATPDSVTIADAQACKDMHLALPVFVKPVAEGTGKGVTPEGIVRRHADLAPVCRRLIERYRQPVIVESYLPGREFTVGVLGTGSEATAVGALEVILRPGAERDVYSYENKERCEELVIYQIAHDATAQRACELALAAWRAIDGRDAGRLDIRCDEHGTPFLLEINPLAGMHPEHSDLPILCTQAGISFIELVEAIVTSASRRIGSPALLGAA